jgi:hypothetical protein
LWFCAAAGSAGSDCIFERLRIEHGYAQVAQSSVDILTAQAALQKERIAGAEASVRATEADLTQTRLEHVRQNTLVSAAASPRRNLETAVAAEGISPGPPERKSKTNRRTFGAFPQKPALSRRLFRGIEFLLPA